MKKFLLPLLIFCCSAASAQDTIQIKKHILQCGDSMATSFKTKNWKKLASYSVPALVEMLGGEEGFIEMTSGVMNQIPDTAIKHFSIGAVVQLLKTKDGWQCIVEQHMKMHLEGMQVTSKSLLLGISSDGKKWTFVDTKGDVATAKMFVPEIDDRIVIPKPVQDIVYPQAPKKD